MYNIQEQKIYSETKNLSSHEGRYLFHGKYKKQKALKNQKIRKRMHLEEIETEARIIREKEEEKTRQKIKAKENTNGSI